MAKDSEDQRFVWGPRPLGSLIPHLTKPVFRKKSPAGAMLMADWAEVVGPALAGLLIHTVGYGWCFLVDGLSYLAVIAGLWLMRTAELRPAPVTPRIVVLEDAMVAAKTRPGTAGAVAGLVARLEAAGLAVRRAASDEPPRWISGRVSAGRVSSPARSR